MLAGVIEGPLEALPPDGQDSLRTGLEEHPFSSLKVGAGGQAWGWVVDGHEEQLGGERP